MLADIVEFIVLVCIGVLLGIISARFSDLQRKLNAHCTGIENLLNKFHDEVIEEFSALNEDMINLDLKNVINKGFLELGDKIKPVEVEQIDNDQYFKNEDGLYSYKAMQENKRLGQDPTARRK